MRHIIRFFSYYLHHKLVIGKNADAANIRDYLKNKKYVMGRRVQPANELNEMIAQKIVDGQSFLAGRFGATELSAIKTFDFAIKSKYNTVMQQMTQWSGFFPQDERLLTEFKDLMLSLIHEADVMGIWLLPFEDYYLNQYASKQLQTTYLLDLEPWSSPKNPWSAALKGKKVLVIHPFAETIQSQYTRREELFPGTEILPEFELITLKAVQTVAGEKDDRFNTWFDALDWMYEEAMKIDFDVAIIGCGAYGFPLAAKLKKSGKQAIHLAGATQLLFGIKGKRWEERKAFSYVQRFFNDAWVYPSEQDKPQNADKVEGGCYW